ncbi:MAG TPA: hypothetical protein VMD99_14200 [Terriglobales bacterium]|nr:hypothetical protein [Terriglobales bacterium]
MNNEPVCTAKQNNVSFGDINTVSTLDYESIAGPDCGQHTQASGAHAQAAAATQYFGRHFAFKSTPVEGQRRRIHDALVFPAQLACVILIFPHESAEVTNTCSWRKAGFS